ncbi:hypothetical protein BC826DRAFT_921748, partial [Russula brevipes]
STTIALSAWCHYCKESNLKSCIFPCDVVTWGAGSWCSLPYNMLKFVLEYHTMIDVMIADKLLRLQKFESGDEEWLVVEDLVAIIQENCNGVRG